MSALERQPHDPMRRQVTVLVIEDEPDFAFILESMLACSAAPEISCRFAYRLQDGARIAAEGGIDVILLDLSLPDSPPIETLERLQEHSGNTPIVVLTAHDDTRLAVETVSRGAQDYLLKSEINRFVLVRTLLQAIERQKIRREYVRVARELQAVNERLEKLILLDPLTELLNRRGIQEALARELERMRRDSSDMVAMLFDLDDFSRVNDMMGHAVGDVILREIARRISAQVRQTDYVARVGGDEFMVLMPQTRMAEGARVAAKIRRAVGTGRLPLPMESGMNLTASFGLISVTREIVSIDALIARAHATLETSKKNGKNQVTFEHHDAPSEPDDRSAEILAALKDPARYRALKQPIIDLDSRRRVGYEFLSRFSVAGLELPDDFFRVCLENNLLTLVDHQCLKNCVSAGHALPAGLKKHLNVFPSTLIDIPARNLAQIFCENGRESEYCLEISEQQIIGDPSYLVEPVSVLRSTGVEIAIDDVGFGRSCLESLILLEPDIVKIDKKWVNGIAKNAWVERSLTRLLRMTDALGADVVAEGIEAEEDAQALKALGVHYGQGYYFGRPE